jgi:hypothetical protein
MSEIWFDVPTNTLLAGESQEMMARIEEVDPGNVIPLHDLLTMDQLPLDTREITKQSPQNWSREDCIALGATTLELISHPAQSQRPSLTRDMLLRLHTLGLGPLPRSFIGTGRLFSTLDDYRAEIGAPLTRKPHNRFAKWSTQDYIDYAARLEADLQRKPKEIDYERRAKEDPEAPSYPIIRQAVKGGLRMLHEHLGYVNTRTWDPEDYIEFGVKFITANGQELLSYTGINALSARKRGPGYTSIIETFGSWAHYRKQVFKEYGVQAIRHAQEHDQKIKEYTRLIKTGVLPPEYANLPEDKLLVYGGRHKLLVQLAHSMGADRRKSTAEVYSMQRFVSILLTAEESRNLTIGRIELEASILGIYDDLWPMDQYKEHLKVTPEEVANIRACYIAAKRSRTRNYKTPAQVAWVQVINPRGGDGQQANHEAK